MRESARRGRSGRGEEIARMSARVFDLFFEELADAVAERIALSATVGKRLFTLAEAAEYIGRTPKAVENLIQRGAIPVTKLDGKRQVDREALDRVIAERTFYEG
jgi:excisionase family DNA binding protein